MEQFNYKYIMNSYLYRMAPITIEWHQLPTMPLRVIPCLSHALLHDTSFHLSENITLLDPSDELVED